MNNDEIDPDNTCSKPIDTDIIQTLVVIWRQVNLMKLISRKQIYPEPRWNRLFLKADAQVCLGVSWIRMATRSVTWKIVPRVKVIRSFVEATQIILEVLYFTCWNSWWHWHCNKVRPWRSWLLKSMLDVVSCRRPTLFQFTLSVSVWS